MLPPSPEDPIPESLPLAVFFFFLLLLGVMTFTSLVCTSEPWAKELEEPWLDPKEALSVRFATFVVGVSPLRSMGGCMPFSLFLEWLFCLLLALLPVLSCVVVVVVVEE